jgi:hypothetical protein
MRAIEKLDAEIQQLQQEATAAEQAGPSFDERWPDVEAQLLDAENVFRSYGPLLRSFPHELPEMAYRRYQAAVGAAMIANPKALLDSERVRIRAETANGVPAADKARRLDQLRRQILQAAARRELLVRDLEGDNFMVRPVHPELVVYRRAEVERLAAAR